MTETAAPVFALLTQDDCPQCTRLKRMLEQPLRGRFTDQIQVVHRQEHPGAFSELTAQHGIRSTPALLHLASGRLLTETGSLGEVSAFLNSAVSAS
ncbi:glutaredoxin family protein [Deinococcus ruber]|uniref:Thioredoxin-like fold domain-containing protein n=1 Tax=Deinococcus ruber TaxID=1848197 RepID=A0A918FGA3_9DEIO|nr:thioredoxin fold domain-containing protein [Deinococcus ruber]GGR35974.1 hypothetical protein GCM10008957_52240 [Deinococcus ruber]